MIIYCCPKCKMTDLGEAHEQKLCMRCSIPMLSTDITSAIWNDLDPDQMTEAVDNCVNEYNRINALEEASSPVREQAFDEVPRGAIPQDTSGYMDNSSYDGSVSYAETSSDEEAPSYDASPSYTESPADEYTEEPVRTEYVPPNPDQKALSRRKSVSAPVGIGGETAPATADGNGKFSALSIVAFVLSLLGITSIIGIILGIIDLILCTRNNDNRRKGLSIAAIAVGAFIIIMGFVLAFITGGLRYIYKSGEASAVEQVVTPAPTEAPVAEPTEEPTPEPEPEPEPAETPAPEPAEEAEEEEEEETLDEISDEEDEDETLEEVSDEEETDAETSDNETKSDKKSDDKETSKDSKGDKSDKKSDEEDKEDTSEEDRSDEGSDEQDVQEDDRSADEPDAWQSDDWGREHASAAIAAASIALNGFIGDYQMSLDPQSWSLSRYDDSDTVIGMTDITYNGKKGKFIYVGTLHMNDAGKIQSAETHYIRVNGEVLNDDGYCENVPDTIKGLSR